MILRRCSTFLPCTLAQLHNQKRASCNKSVDNKPISGCVRMACSSLLQRLVASCQFADLLNNATTCIKSVDKLKQTCCQQAVASHANASWYRLFVNRLVATCGVFSCVRQLYASAGSIKRLYTLDELIWTQTISLWKFIWTNQSFIHYQVTQTTLDTIERNTIFFVGNCVFRFSRLTFHRH